MDFSVVNQKIAALDRRIGNAVAVGSREYLYVGVDLGTASVVLTVLNEKKEPVACAVEFAQVVKDGLVVDYLGAIRIVRELTLRIEKELGRELVHAAIAVPPGTGKGDCATHRHVVESAGLEVIALLDEPTAANAVLGIAEGAIVDIGGGTTGISILRDGKVTYVADEATGGTHLTLVLAGRYGISFADAEALKQQKERQKEILSVVWPVLEKMSAIINTHIKGRNVPAIFLVGGTCCLEGMEAIIERKTGKAVFKPANPFLVTPLGIALNCERG